MSSIGLISSLTIAVRDVGVVVNDSNHTPILHENVLFLSSSLENADSNDNRIMRDSIGIQTVVNTDTIGHVHHRYDQKSEGRYLVEEIITDKILGLTSCRVNLRSSQWSKNLLSELPWQARMKLDFKVAFTQDRSKIHEVEPLRNLLRPRNRVDESFALLETSAGTIGRLFKDLLAAPQAFPLIIRGNVFKFDHTLILFVLLLMLDVPIHVIEHTDLCCMKDVLYDSRRQSEAVQVNASQAATEARWASDLKRRLDAKYGGMDAFLSAAGITEETRKGIQSILLPNQTPSEKTLIDVS